MKNSKIFRPLHYAALSGAQFSVCPPYGCLHRFPFVSCRSSPCSRLSRAPSMRRCTLPCPSSAFLALSSRLFPASFFAACALGLLFSPIRWQELALCLVADHRHIPAFLAHLHAQACARFPDPRPSRRRFPAPSARRESVTDFGLLISFPLKPSYFLDFPSFSSYTALLPSTIRTGSVLQTPLCRVCRIRQIHKIPPLLRMAAFLH